MPDWKEVVRERLGAEAVASAEVVVELAGHLEEIYDDAISRGLNEAVAAEVALQEVEDWRVLAADICRAKPQEDLMNYRTKSLWLPALITLLGASVALAVMQFLGMQPRRVWIGGMGITFYWPWLGSLPMFSALGAWLSRKSQGQTSARLVAGMSPAVVMLIVMSLILPFGLVIDGWHFIRLVGFGLGLANWVVLPGMALLVGALPFVRETQVGEA
jgi:hypothetical protein